jgi:predicted metalloprotease with PDZ domain
MKKRILFLLITTLQVFFAFSQNTKNSIAFTVSMENPSRHYFHVEMQCRDIKKESLLLKMPVWTPGYYQRLDFANNVENFHAADAKGKEIKSSKTSGNSWQLETMNAENILVSYDVKTTRPFVGTAYLDENRAYILPGAVFMFIDGMIQHEAEVIIKPQGSWDRVATGLDSVAGKKFTYTAPDFDILYDSPLLVGNLEELPSFTVKGIPHRFMGYQLGNFDKAAFMNDLKKVIEAATDMMGDIPYKHYTFISIGPGAGGIEHLNSASVSFNGSSLSTPEGKLRVLHFLAHEYFHHYNVKRIRPIELGPFDYDNGSRTKLLWVSEGLSVYYEYMIVHRAGLSTTEELFNAFRNNMLAFEGKPGRLFQTLEQSSYETWSDGPFGRTGDEVNKTISYYDKGPVVGLLFDFKIRQLTQNKKSLDDVMRFVYKEYYQKKKRGFTDAEFRAACEKIAGASLADVFEYVTTTKEIDYPTYFSYAGLSIDTTSKEMPGAYSGISTRERNDSLFITTVDWESPAWQAGLRARQPILEINGAKATIQLLKETTDKAHTGDKITFTVISDNGKKTMEVVCGKKKERSFNISPVQNLTPLQKQIFESWLKG